MAVLSRGNTPSGASARSDWMSNREGVGGGGVGISDPAFSPQMLGQLYTVIGLKQLANISNY